MRGKACSDDHGFCAVYVERVVVQIGEGERNVKAVASVCEVSMTARIRGDGVKFNLQVMALGIPEGTGLGWSMLHVSTDSGHDRATY